MYRNLDECLRDVYRFGALRIEPMGNTAQVMAHLQGNVGKSSDLTQAEWHANAAMIQAQVAGCLKSRLLVAVVACQYGQFDGLSDLASVLVARGVCDDVIFAAQMLQHIYSGGRNPRRVDLMDKWNLHDMTFSRKRDKVKRHLAQWEQQARFLLDADFKQKGIVFA